MKQHRLAFVGLGRVADVHYESVQAMPERAWLAAVCDIRPEAVDQRKKEWGVPGFTSFEELLQKVDVDAVCLLLPHNVHAEVVEVAARHGKAVFLEKPIDVSLEKAQRIVDVVRESGITLMVAHNCLFHPAFEQTVEFVRRGWLGRPLFASATSAGWLTFRSWDFMLKKDETGGGCWIDAGCHLVYCLRELLGEVDYVTGLTAKLSRPEMEGEDHAIAALRYKSGAIAQLFVSYGHKLPGYELDWPRGYLNSIDLYGDKGAIQYIIGPEPRLNYFSEIPEAMPSGWAGWLTHQPAEPYTSSFRRELEHFLDCLDTGQTPRVTASDGLAALRVLLGLYERCKEERTLA
jgi:predicted dehydrogenase